MSNKGKWNAAYSGLSNPEPYGDTKSYELAETWLSKRAIEDWGCGKGWFKTIHQGKYIGVDGSQTPFADKVEELTRYTSKVNSIVLRHVLEHDKNWEKIWENALISAEERIALILFTPISAGETLLNSSDTKIGVPDLSPSTNKILTKSLHAGYSLIHCEHIRSHTRYGAEVLLVFSRQSQRTKEDSIPKIIHQFWDGPLKPPTELMDEIKKQYTSQGWEYMLWSTDSIKERTKEGKLFNENQYNEMPEWSGKCDIARYEILNEFGGVFMDADSKHLRILDDYLLENEFFAGYENEIIRPGLVACGCIGSKPGNSLLEYIISKIALLKGKRLHPDSGQASTHKTHAWKSVGPELLTTSIKELGYRDIAIYPSFYFIPKHYIRTHSSSHYNGSFRPYCESLWGSTPGSKFEYNEFYVEEQPLVSICTVTRNREGFLALLLKCIESQDYPHEKIEWIILDDSENHNPNLKIETNSPIIIKHQRLSNKVALGEKRNISHKLCSGDVIVYMDDDDYYPPSRVSHAVKTLKNSKTGIAASTLLPIFFTHDNQLWVSGPFDNNHGTAGTFAMTREFARTHYYSNQSICNEEKSFLNDYTIKIAQLDPEETMICISHSRNTFDKKKMRAQGETRKMKRAGSEDFKSLLANFDSQKYVALSRANH